MRQEQGPSLSAPVSWTVRQPVLRGGRGPFQLLTTCGPEPRGTRSVPTSLIWPSSQGGGAGRLWASVPPNPSSARPASLARPCPCCCLLLLGGSSSTHGHCAPPTRGRGLGQVCQQDPSSALEGARPQRGGLVLFVRRPTGPQIKGTHCLPCTEERSLWSPHKRLITRLLSTTLRWLISLDG